MKAVCWQWTWCRVVSLHLAKIFSMAFYIFRVIVIMLKMFAKKSKTMWNPKAHETLMVLCFIRNAKHKWGSPRGLLRFMNLRLALNLILWVTYSFVLDLHKISLVHVKNWRKSLRFISVLPLHFDSQLSRHQSHFTWRAT